jgi:hypothetical protein
MGCGHSAWHTGVCGNGVCGDFRILTKGDVETPGGWGGERCLSDLLASV